MKKYLLKAFVAALAVTAGCGGGAQKQTPSDADTDMADVYADDEKTIFGICGEGSAMNTLQVITDNGDTLSLSVSDAKDAGRVLGGYGSGDRMAVLLSDDKTSAVLVINETTLLGSWTMPNPVGGSSVAGISLKDGGVAESIGQGTVVYKAWRIVNGQLEIMCVSEDGGDNEETNVYNIVKLDADSLVYKNDKDRFGYGRLNM